MHVHYPDGRGGRALALGRLRGMMTPQFCAMVDSYLRDEAPDVNGLDVMDLPRSYTVYADSREWSCTRLAEKP